MKAHRVALLAVVVVGIAGIVTAQTDWVEHPDNPLIGPGEPGSWDSGGHWLHEVVFDGSMYHMWFTGVEAGGDWWDIGHATSTDGVSWTMDPANPVLLHGDSGEWDDWGVSAHGVVYDGTLFHMWYSGVFHDGKGRVGYATSPDGSVWTKSEHNPVMDVGPPGSWQADGVSPSTVILDGDVYRMWYVGATFDGGLVGRVGYAWSSDGIVWDRRPEPVIDVGFGAESFDRNVVAHPEVVFDGNLNLYHMWYAGVSREGHYRIGYAYSTDGIQWTKHRYNPVLERPIYEVDGPNVLIEGSTFRMWFEDDDGSAYQINLATSECCPGEPALDDWRFIPAAAVASGAQGAFFQTDVDLNNAGSQPVEYQFLWLPRGEDNEAPTTSEMFTLGAGMSVRYANVLTEVFGLEPNSLGAIALKSTSPDLLAMSRTYNTPTGDPAGTFGQAMPAVAPGEFIQSGEVRRILFASEHVDLRTNVGCQNGSDIMLTGVNLELYDSEGNHLDTERMLLDPWSNDQLNQVFDAYRPVIGYVDVSTPMPNRSFYCYGSVLDNVTSDPTTIPPQ